MDRRTFPRFLLAVAAAVALLPAQPAHGAQLTPLPPPGQPVASNITTTGATLTWARPQGPVFRYAMQQLVNGQWAGYASMPSNTFTLAGLTPNTTYTFAVYAAPLAGSGYSLSPLSPPVTFTTLAVDLWICRIGISQWNGGFSVNGSLFYSGPSPALPWRVTFTIANSLTVNQVWGGMFARSGTQGSIAGYQGGPPPPPGPIAFGFTGTYTGTFIAPTQLKVNGVTCQVT